MVSMRYLVIHDVDAIQRYVFATNRLREIRGASALLEHLNSSGTRDLIRQHYGELIYVGGGGAAAEFDTEEAAKAFSHAVSLLYAEQTGTASSTGVVVEYDIQAPDSDAQSFRSALIRAHQQLRDEKARRAHATHMLTCAYFKRCQACGIYPAAHYDSHLPEQQGRFVCASCFTKRQQEHESPVHRRIRKIFGARHKIAIRFPLEVDDIGNAANAGGYIGVVYADGNRMGDRLQRITSKKSLQNFSRTIDQATRTAIASALTYRRDLLTHQHMLPILVPLCGGDDMVIITPGHQALQIAVEYLQSLQDRVRHKMPQEVADLLGSREVSSCAGVAIAKAHTPLSALLELAHDLCGSAKQRSYDLFTRDGREEPCVDFRVITTPNWSKTEAIRTTSESVRLTCRPYTVNEEGLITAIQTLKQANVPPGKLHELYRNLWQGRHQATLSYLTLYVRARESAAGSRQQSALRKAAQHLQVDEAPWRPWAGRPLGWETPYADVVEMYPFVVV
jgi:hypothetical protein